MKEVLLMAAIAFFLAGCSYLGVLGDWANENPAVADLVVSQAVHRYIDEDADKATRVVASIAATEQFLEGTPTTTVDALFDVLNASINWDNLSTADQALAQGLIVAVQVSLEQKQIDGELDPDEVLGIKSLLRTARRAAEAYVT
jgi:hypothetical protein